MKMMIKRVLILLIVFFGLKASAQKKTTLLPLTADSLSTGNYKDVFRSFFQLAFDRLTSPNRHLQFTSNPFAVMARADTTMLVDSNYYRYRHLRGLNFSFGVKLDSSFSFNGFSSGVKYALINKRDETISREFVKNAYEANDENNRLNNALTAYITTIDINDPKRQLYRKQANDLFSGAISFNQVDKEFQKVIKNKAKDLRLENFLSLLKEDPKLNVGQVKQFSYDSLRKLFQQGLLLTVGISDTTYKDQFAFKNIVASTQLLKGISNPLKSVGWELDLRGFFHFEDDIVKAGRNLQRSFFVFDPGMNVLFKIKRT